ncbi:MAG TPA: CoA transferase [Ilumatobacter sp.]|nr:CoA transferase [Ilumatobacter sp.]
MSGPLNGIKVVEVSVAMAAPFCGQVLADYGADVIKIERVGPGDDSRVWPPFHHGQLGHYFASANRGKRSLAVDLKSERGAELVRRLASDADVLLQNYRLGAMERAGLGYDDLSAINPRLIYCSITGFGRHGERRAEPANDLFMQAFSGGMSITGEPGSAPVKMGISTADIGAGLFATVGILSALEARHHTGRGQHVDTSLLAGQLAMLSYHLTAFDASGIVPGPQGSGSEIGVPYGAFPTADDWLVVAVFNDSMWRNFCAAIEQPALADDPRYREVAGRKDNKRQLLELLEQHLRTRSAADWEATMREHGVPSTRVNRIDQVLADPQVADNAMVAEVEVPGVGPIRVPAPPINYSETPGAIGGPPPRIGEHSRPILLDLGLSDDEIAALVGDGVVGVDGDHTG